MTTRLRRLVLAAAVAVALSGVVAPAIAAPVTPAGTVAASPTTGLGWRDDVVVTISGAGPGVHLRILQCFSGPEDDADCVLRGTTRTTDSGRARHTVLVHRSVIGEEGGGDCWAEGVGCTLEVFRDTGGQVGEAVPLVFDPATPPPPPPTVSVTPTTGLPGTAQVQLEMSGLLREGNAIAQECPPAGAAQPCRVAGAATADTSGRLHGVLSVTRLIGGFPYDCATSAAPCVLRVTSDGSHVSEFALRFDPDAPLPPGPTMVAAPTANLYDDDTVVAVGHGFTASPSVAMAVCTADVVSTAQCDATNFAFLYTHVDSFIMSLRVHPVIHTAAGAIDCRVAPGRCVLVGVTFSDLSQTARVPLTFAASDDPSVVVHDLTIGEAAGEAHIVVTLSKPSARSVTIEYVTRHGTARPGTDYVRIRRHLVFAPGETRHVVRVPLVDDHVRESTEQFRIEVDHADGAHVAVPGGATVTIRDDD